MLDWIVFPHVFPGRALEAGHRLLALPLVLFQSCRKSANTPLR